MGWQNHLSENEYKIFMKNPSFSKWDKIIPFMVDWGIISTESNELLSQIRKIRDNAVHYNTSIDKNIEESSLQAIKLMIKYVDIQFNAVNQEYLFYHPQDGAIYVKNEYRLNNYVKKIVIPNTQLVSTNHKIVTWSPNSGWVFEDTKPRKYRDISDENFLWWRKKFLDTSRHETIESSKPVNVMISTIG